MCRLTYKKVRKTLSKGLYINPSLGQSKMQTTQDSYGKVVERKISLEMERLKGSG